MNKRRLLIKAMAGMGVSIMTRNILAQQTSATGTAIKRSIASSGEQIPVIGLGTYQAFDVGSDAAVREQLGQVLRELVAKGGSVIDSSPMYGRAESVVGELTAKLNLRPSLFLATKVWTSGREAGIRQMEESFRLLRTQTMDLMQIHNLVDWRVHTVTLKDWKQKGRVRYIGITHYHSGAYDELERLIKTRDYDFVQLNYSIAEREAERSILPLAQQMGVAVIANRPFAQSSLFSRVRGKTLPPWAAEFDCTTWAQFFLKYIVSHPALTCAIPATNKPEHLKDNMMAGVGRLPDAQTRRKMADYIDAV
jgi:diketogulonate reductase-like aldo/keto reductase